MQISEDWCIGCRGAQRVQRDGGCRAFKSASLDLTYFELSSLSAFYEANSCLIFMYNPSKQAENLLYKIKLYGDVKIL